MHSRRRISSCSLRTGDPTAYNEGSGQKTNTSNTEHAEQGDPSGQCDQERRDQVFGVGVGSALNNTDSQNRLKKISGPNAATGDNVAGADVIFVQDFGALASKLASIAREMCKSSVTITKKVDADGDGQFENASDWTFKGTLSVPGTHTWVQPPGAGTGNTAEDRTDLDGTVNFKWNAGQSSATFAFQETVKPGFRMVRVGCSPSSKFKAGENGGTFTGLLFDETATCTVWNATNQIALCHWTGRDYQKVTASVADDGSLDPEHRTHVKDVIPPYPFLSPNGASEEKAYEGKNWDKDGQARWQNGCQGGVLPPPDEPIVPTVRCVEQVDGGGLLAHFGYDNPADTTATIMYGDRNYVRQVPGERLSVGQPQEFAPGPHLDVLQVQFGADGGVEWVLDGTTAHADQDSKACGASITIVKSLDPDTDPGRFNLTINGNVRGTGGAVGNGGTTGTVAVDAGPYKVGESGAQDTKLDDYNISIVCRNGSEDVATGEQAAGLGGGVQRPGDQVHDHQHEEEDAAHRAARGAAGGAARGARGADSGAGQRAARAGRRVHQADEVRLDRPLGLPEPHEDADHAGDRRRRQESVQTRRRGSGPAQHVREGAAPERLPDRPRQRPRAAHLEDRRHRERVHDGELVQSQVQERPASRAADSTDSADSNDSAHTAAAARAAAAASSA